MLLVPSIVAVATADRDVPLKLYRKTEHPLVYCSV
jgi:hypothetical protein